MITRTQTAPTRLTPGRPGCRKECIMRGQLTIHKIEVQLVDNLLMMDGLAHHYHLGGSNVIFRGVRSDFEFLFHFG